MYRGSGMISVRNISLGYKASLIFAVLSLILSLVTGFVAGVRWEVVLVRSVILMIVFAGIGFGICFIVQRFVPEVYQFLSSFAGAGPGAGAGEPEADLPGMGPETEAAGEELPQHEESAGAGGEAATTQTGEFSELEKEGLAHYSSAPGATSVNTRGGKLGKHILEKEKMAKYEPKIMAQAVRTMMGKDRD
jgi:hypothetical protein